MSTVAASTSELNAELETVNLSVSTDGAATVELNRPQALNAWNKQFGEDLLRALTAVAEDDGVRAVMITGAGRAFSSGADLKDMGSTEGSPDGRPDVYTMLTERYHPIIHAVREMPKPVIAAVGGRPQASVARSRCAAISSSPPRALTSCSHS